MTQRAAKPTALQRERLLQILVETKSFNFSPTPVFPLASGSLSQYYIDCKIGLSYPEARQLIAEMILDLVIPAGLDAVGGLALGAYPIATAVSDAAYRMTGRVLRAFVIRKEPKKHGLRKRVEGDVRHGDRVLIVDDVITSGGSTVEAIERSRQEGLTVVKAIALVDRQEQDGRANIERLGVEFSALCTLEDLLSLHSVQRMAKG